MFILNEFNERVESIQRQSVMLVELASQVISEAAVIGDYDMVQRVLDISVANSVFHQAQYIDLSGGKLTAFASLPEERGWVAHIVEPLIAQALTTVNRPINVGGKDYGILRLEFEARTLSNALHDFAFVTFLVSLVSFSLGIILLWIPMRRWLRPLTNVANATGTKNDALGGITPELLQSAPAEFQAVLAKVVSTAEELQFQLQEREEVLSRLLSIAAELKGAPDNSGELSGGTISISNAIDAISRLVAERESVNLALMAAKHSAEEANQAKTVFLATISHDIRTPMNGILAMANVLHEENDLTENSREIAGTIFRSAHALLALLNDVLDISQVESGKMEVHNADFDVDTLMSDCLSTFAQSAANNRVNLIYPEKTGARFVSDAARIRQMLSNLVSNAIKFNAGGNVSVSAAISSDSTKRRILSVIVKDDGPGISNSQLQKLFQPFSQLEQKRSAQHGSGLGLSIVRKLAELMGGTADVKSAPGEGAIFYFHLPCADIDPSNSTTFSTKVSSEPRETAESGTASPKPFSRSKIMVIDDTHSNLFVLEVLLKKLGAEVWAFDNAEEALTAIEHGQQVDLILMDLQMPKMDGIEATLTLRKWEQLNGKAPTPVVAVTAAAYTADQVACMAVGMNSFLTKPIMPKSLRDTLIPILQAARG